MHSANSTSVFQLTMANKDRHTIPILRQCKTRTISNRNQNITQAESSSLINSSSFGLEGAAGDAEPSTPISSLSSLMLCSNSFIRFPISSRYMKRIFFVTMESDIVWNLFCWK
ncbi:hypothetical protein Lalb_Chr02g0143201 [Lupinus albus]|uniref:Uncharacterized protein n=1 Tax=Lupinus albus TaxID=3870 RepID=A0A6A4QY10_LUPAL|nr:hypothetical protein Lalb_Chr02g0143201 [Lupinus albus]